MIRLSSRPAILPRSPTAARTAVEGGATLVVLAGGDGTIRDAAGSLADTGVDVGILPCGTGNLYATSVGVPRSLDDAVRMLGTGTPRAFDVGEVRLVVPPGGVSTNVPASPVQFGVACGTGFDADLIGATDRDMKRRYGVVAYFLAASRLLPRLTARPTVLVIDGVRTELESVVVLVANAGEAIPGLLRPRLPIEPDDGLFHVFVLPRGGIIGGIRGAMELLIGESHGTSPSGTRSGSSAARSGSRSSRPGRPRSTATRSPPPGSTPASGPAACA